MIVTHPRTIWPNGAVVLHWIRRTMDVILHLGAHRTGTTTLQDYMQRHQDYFASQNTAFWGPRRTRSGIFSGLMPGPVVGKPRDPAARAAGRLQVQMSVMERRGVETLFVSDENMIGSVRNNLRGHALYPAIGERMARFAKAFGGRLTRVMICTRSLELFWASSMAYAVGRGHSVPDPFTCRRIALSRRGWRDVITDLSCAMPGVDIRVLPFENYMGRSEVLVKAGADVSAPIDRDRQWLNRGPGLPDLRRVVAERGVESAAEGALPFGMGRWNPFTPEDTAALRELYADDMMWLVAGADGLATLTEDCAETRAGPTPPVGAQNEGRYNEHQKGRMA